jgi:hypothetical protein
MGCSATSRQPAQSIPLARSPVSCGRASPATPRELATQAPHLIGYTLQQFVRLAGAQCRMTPTEVAYHNREHDRSRRTR